METRRDFVLAHSCHVFNAMVKWHGKTLFSSLACEQLQQAGQLHIDSNSMCKISGDTCSKLRQDGRMYKQMKMENDAQFRLGNQS